MNTNDFFANFPLIQYNGETAVDITKSIDMSANLVSNSVFLTPYTMNQSLRSDQLAYQLYGDQTLEYLIFLSNGMIDGFDWFMDQSTFYTYMNSKYGDWVLTQQQVAYYINNWYLDPGIALSVSAYDALDPSLVKYYEPIFDGAQNIIGYSRRQVDWIINTNHLVQFTFDPAIIYSFVNNEIVTVTWDTGITANGQVSFQFCSNDANADITTVGPNLLNIQHVNGDYNFANTINALAFSIVGSQSNSVITITDKKEVTHKVYDTVAPEEDVFYSPMTIFDDENVKNQNKKYIYYLSNNFTSQAIRELKGAF